MVYPIGSIYINASDSTNPATLLGFGTWVAFGAGRVMVGKASSGTFQTAGATGGAETHTLSVNEMPSHTHNTMAFANTGGAVWAKNPSASGYGSNGSINGSVYTGQALATGGGGSHNNLQPYIVVYVWERTA